MHNIHELLTICAHVNLHEFQVSVIQYACRGLLLGILFPGIATVALL